MARWLAGPVDEVMQAPILSRYLGHPIEVVRTASAVSLSQPRKSHERHQRAPPRAHGTQEGHHRRKIAAANKEIGIIIVNTGNGKGKSSSGFGMVIRAMGHGMKVGVVQFIKGAMSTGEEKFLRRFPDEVSFHAMGEGYTWETQDRERDIRQGRTGRGSRPGSSCPIRAIGLVLFDELNIALKYRYLDVDTVIADLLERPRCSTSSSPAAARRKN
jgi:cob(I)alamin adenosyltransferase